MNQQDLQDVAELLGLLQGFTERTGITLTSPMSDGIEVENGAGMRVGVLRYNNGFYEFGHPDV